MFETLAFLNSAMSNGFVKNPPNSTTIDNSQAKAKAKPGQVRHLSDDAVWQKFSTHRRDEAPGVVGPLKGSESMDLLFFLVWGDTSITSENVCYE